MTNKPPVTTQHTDELKPLRLADNVVFPKQILEEHLHDLSGPEYKVLSYIILRTIGRGKQGDHIAGSQFTHGIARGDGVVMDHGTGCSASAVRVAIDSLEQRGLIIVERAGTNRRGDINRYTLNAR